MANFLNEIENGLLIDEPKFLLPWSLQKHDLFNIVNDIKKINDNYYKFALTLSGIPFINCAGLHFEKEKLSKVDLFNDKTYWSESEIFNIYNDHQFILENCFGKPIRNYLLDKFNGFYKECIWKFRNIKIVHKLWDRFGLEENLIILIN